MAEPCLDVLKAYSICKKKAGAAMAKIMKANSSHSISLKNFWQLCSKIARFH